MNETESIERERIRRRSVENPLSSLSYILSFVWLLMLIKRTDEGVQMIRCHLDYKQGGLE